MELNSNQIQEIIPHRYPFLLVDKITELEPGVKAKGIKCVTANEMHFMGHFPQHHVMPGVLIIEAMAQVGAVAILSVEENKGKIAFFGGIQLLCIGIMGQYIAKTYLEVKERPHYIIGKTNRSDVKRIG